MIENTVWSSFSLPAFWMLSARRIVTISQKLASILLRFLHCTTFPRILSHKEDDDIKIDDYRIIFILGRIHCIQNNDMESLKAIYSQPATKYAGPIIYEFIYA